MGLPGYSFLSIYFLLWARSRLFIMNTNSRYSKSFNEISNLISMNRLEELGRNQFQEQQYQRIKKKIELQWDSISDYILYNIFHFPYLITSHDNKRKVIRPLPSWANGLIRIVPNDFPYNFQSDVKHYLLWKINDQIYENDIIHGINELKKQYHVINSCYFINPRHLKSILDIEHAHIILQIASPGSSSSSSSNITRSIWGNRIKKGLIYGVGGFSFLIFAKLLHTGDLYHSLVREIMELKDSFSLIKFMKFYTKFFVPFPLSMLANFLIKRLTFLMNQGA